MNYKINILLVDDQVMTHDIIKRIREFDVVGVVKTSGELLELYESVADQVDVVLMDLMLEPEIASGKTFRFSGIDLIKSLVEFDPNVKVIAFTQFEYDEMIHSAYINGALGYLNKNVPLVDLVKSVMDVSQGKRIYPIVSNGEVPKRYKILSDPLFFSLTPKEIEVVERFSSGCSSEEVADALSLTKGSFNNLVSSIIRKCGLANRVELVSHLAKL